MPTRLFACLLACNLTLFAAPGALAAEDAPDRDIELSGALLDRHAHFENASISNGELILQTSKGPVRVIPTPGVPLPGLGAVTLTGRMGADGFHITRPRSTARSTSTRNLAGSTGQGSRGIQKLLVIPVTFPDDRSQPVTAGELRTWVFGKHNSVRGYFAAASRGKLLIRGDARGSWLELDSSPGADCNVDRVTEEAFERLGGKDALYSRYRSFVFIFPKYENCEWSGMGQLGGLATNDLRDYGRLTWINLAFKPGAPDGLGFNPSTRHLRLRKIGTMVHELGHNFGLFHATTGHCLSGGKRVPLASHCLVQPFHEYRDPYDVMGSGTRYHRGVMFPNAWNRRLLGWLPPKGREFLEVTRDTTVTIQSTKLPASARGTTAVRIPARRMSTSSPALKCGELILEFRSGREKRDTRGDLEWNKVDYYEFLEPKEQPADGLLLHTVYPVSHPGGETDPDPAVKWVGGCRATMLIDAAPNSPRRQDFGVRVGQSFTDTRVNGTQATLKVTKLVAGKYVKVKIDLPGGPPKPPAAQRPSAPAPTTAPAPSSGGGIL